MKFRRLEENGKNAEISILPDRIDIDPGEPGNLLNEQAKELMQSIKGSTTAFRAPTAISNPRRLANKDCDLYCPVADCTRSTRGFAEANRLMRHLCQVHNGLNLFARSSEDKMIAGCTLTVSWKQFRQQKQ